MMGMPYSTQLFLAMPAVFLVQKYIFSRIAPSTIIEKQIIVLHFLLPALLHVVGNELVHEFEDLLLVVGDADVALELFLTAHAEVGVVEYVSREGTGVLLVGLPDDIFLNHQFGIGTLGENAASQHLALCQNIERYGLALREWAEIGELTDADVGGIA